jgi:purine-nucleoside phosphorylase
MDPKDLSFVPYRLAGAFLKKKLEDAGMPSPRVGIICGSGLSGLSETLQEPTLTVQYSDIPGFPAHCTVPGHKGEVVFGLLSGVPSMCFRGRFHSYEGHDMKVTVLPVYVMRCLSTVNICIITNAAGALNPEYNIGDVVCVSDHLAIPQLAGKNPLVGPNDDELGPRFPATSDAYPDDLRLAAMRAAEKMGIDFLIPHGVYCFVSGVSIVDGSGNAFLSSFVEPTPTNTYSCFYPLLQPMFESKAECRFLRSLGGDAVGMSTVPEVVAAHHCNIKVLCLSLMTNKVIMTGDEGAPVATFAEVIETAEKRSKQMQLLVTHIVETLREEVLPKLPPLRQVTLDLNEGAKREYYRAHSSNSGTASFGGEEEELDAQQQPVKESWTVDVSTLLVGATIFCVGALIGSLSASTRTRSRVGA